MGLRKVLFMDVNDSFINLVRSPYLNSWTICFLFFWTVRSLCAFKVFNGSVAFPYDPLHFTFHALVSFHIHRTALQHPWKYPGLVRFPSHIQHLPCNNS